jgi:hypothetical protein
VEWTLRPYGSKSDGIQRFDRPFLRVVCQFDDLIRDGLAEADAGPSTRTVGFTEHHPPLVALGAIVLRSPRLDGRLHSAGIGEIVDNWCEGALKLGMHAPHHDAATETGGVGGVTSGMAYQSVSDPQSKAVDRLVSTRRRPEHPVGPI